MVIENGDAIEVGLKNPYNHNYEISLEGSGSAKVTLKPTCGERASKTMRATL